MIAGDIFQACEDAVELAGAVVTQQNLLAATRRRLAGLNELGGERDSATSVVGALQDIQF